MAEDPFPPALDRLERAVARIEAATPAIIAAGVTVPAPVSASASAPVGDAALAEAYVSLDERHGLLRLRIQETIERLDALIGGAAGDDGADGMSAGGAG